MTDTTHVDEWHGDDVSLADVQKRLGAMRISVADGHSDLRTSVMTHTAWVPKNWLDAARGALSGLDEAHPSRTILLVPDPEAERDAIDASVSVYCFDLPGEARHVCSEVVELHLSGARATSPASVIEPLLISDLPVFSRWRGRPPFGSRELEQMVRVVDRLIVDSGEWEDLPADYAELAECFDQTAVSDIAFRRSLRWRTMLAELWPGIAEVRKLSVTGPEADALLLAGWLRSRLDRKVELEHEEADEIRGVSVDGDPATPPRGDQPDPSQLLSSELDQFGRDPIYEAAVRAAS
ncbi:MAG: glucose-6-phosphate dehydrogenase assembly protein OpcA [Actinobacteria bacterium]|nr:glucose-6-phosphate dehydrogenase assembly protein OpcA [Actinomycetota bacterium]